jgi:5'(3')-deoxyribonucleotidase
MTNNAIIIDLDDTLGDLKVRLQNIYRKKTGRTDIHYRDWKDFNSVTYGYTFDDLTEFFIEDNSLALMRPHAGVVETTARLKSLGYDIHIVTARSWHPDAQNVTEAWLTAANITFDQVHIVPFNMCKEEVTRSIPNIHFFVDDRIEHCKAMQSSGRVEKQVLVFGQPWNETQFEEMPSSDNFQRIEDIREILRFV